MASTIIVGDGPAGLTAALFLAKNGHEVSLYGTNSTNMHYAQLHNYPGIDDIHGTEWTRRVRGQVEGFGVTVTEQEVTSVAADGERFTAATESGEVSADYLILAGGKPMGSLAKSLGLEVPPEGVATDRDGRTDVDRVYVVGRLARPERSQAVISAGAGAAAALDILSREAGKDVHDWDTPDNDSA